MPLLPLPSTTTGRSRRRLLTTLLVAALLVLIALLAWTTLPDRSADPALRHAAQTTPSPYRAAGLERYDRWYRARAADDLDTLVELGAGDDWLAYRAALELARHPDAAPAARLAAFDRALELRVDDPLARAEERALRLEQAGAAELAGESARALAIYREILSEPAARTGLERLETNPYRRANAYLQARRWRDALGALGALSAPSIEAPALRRLGRHAEALDAYRRWLDEVPGDLDARYGVAWSHWYLGDLEAAERAFRALPGANALYGRALIANRRGDLDEAVRLLGATGDADDLWLATGLLERAGRIADALPVYLRLAEGGSAYADDAAYRARVLALRLGRADLAAEATERIPPGSFFDVTLGGGVDVPEESALPDARPEALSVAAALTAANDREAAIGELAFALRAADGEAETVAIAEMMQTLGEYRLSQRAATGLVAAGSRDARTWRLAYPRAYEDVVAEQARTNGLEPSLIWAIMRQESAFYPAAVSVSNAIGLMQVIPSTWDWLAELQGETPGDPYDPATNIRYGSYYLGYLFDYLDDDADLVIPAYNRGQGYIKRLFEGPVVGGDKDELYREIDAFETREYLQRVAINQRVYEALYDDVLAADPTENRSEP